MTGSKHCPTANHIDMDIGVNYQHELSDFHAPLFLHSLVYFWPFFHLDRGHHLDLFLCPASHQTSHPFHLVLVCQETRGTLYDLDPPADSRTECSVAARKCHEKVGILIGDSNSYFATRSTISSVGTGPCVTSISTRTSISPTGIPGGVLGSNTEVYHR